MTLFAPPKLLWYCMKVCMYSCLSGIIFENPAPTLSCVADTASSTVSRTKNASSGLRRWNIQ